MNKRLDKWGISRSSLFPGVTLACEDEIQNKAHKASVFNTEMVLKRKISAHAVCINPKNMSGPKKPTTKELSGESNPSPIGRHLGGDSEEEEEEEESDSEDTSDSDCVEGGVNGEGGGDVTRDIEINDREGRVGEQERGEAESDGEDSDRDTEVSIIQRSERVREDNRNEDSDTEVIVENVQAVLPPDPPPLPAGQPHGHDGHDGEPLLHNVNSGQKNTPFW